MITFSESGEHDYTGAEWEFDDLIDKSKRALKASSAKRPKELNLYEQYGVMTAREKEQATKIGAYLLCESAIANTEIIQFWNKTLPKYVYVGIDMDGSGHKQSEDFVFILCILANKLPPYLKSTGQGVPYEVHRFFYNEGRDELDQDLSHVTIDEKGLVSPCKILCTKMINNIPARQWYLECPQSSDKLTLEKFVTYSFNVWQTRDFHHNAFVSDGVSRVNMVMDVNSVKSIFKERRFEKTRMGRRKPIVHWVSSHYRVRKVYKYWWQRFIFWKKYEEISTVKTHLRGAKKFFVEDLSFKIVTPVKDIDLLNMDVMAINEYELDGKKIEGYDRKKPQYYLKGQAA